MEITLLIGVAEASEATYKDKLHQFKMWNLSYLDAFRTNNFDGYVASNEEVIILAFRGTHSDWNTVQAFADSLGQWLTNVNFSQLIINDSYRVHRGFYEELESGIAQIVKLLNAHGIDKKSLVITGHSAGGALATLAGRRLFEMGARDVQVFTFSAPKVGDSNFVNTYPVPLTRIESKNDLIPFFPLHPMIYEFVGELALFRVMDFADNLFPNLNFKALANVEYHHAGQLLYISPENQLIHRSTTKFWDLLGSELEDALLSFLGDESEKQSHFDGKIIAMPDEYVDFTRISSVFNAVDGALQQNNAGFIKDHALTGIADFMRDLMD